MAKLSWPPTSRACLRTLRPCAARRFASLPRKQLAHPRPGILNDPFLPQPTGPLPLTYFSPAKVSKSVTGLGGSPQQNDHQPPDERVLKLGKTLRTLSPLLPTILYNNLPPEILSPNVNLHLFPSTHPHLPTVKGRRLYRAALWTVPVAWSSIPLVGNVRLQIQSERIVRAGTVLEPDHCGDNDCGDERLVVRWKTEARTESRPFHESSQESSSPAQIPGESSPASNGAETSAPAKQNASTDPEASQSSLSSSTNGTNRGLSKLLGGDEPIFKLSHEEQFTGLFIFSFDEEGRILTHTIEHTDEADGWDRTAKFVTLTDWLIGKARGSLDPVPKPQLMMEHCHHGTPDEARRRKGS
ncbi:hypothetical protein N7468_009805 [Penicillium chermesinum]|uniref:Chromosome transmission fidelity protein 4 n=1 Tax=Penicillium chermesinum TaxID=63820 RepID=A0A9W9TBM2_9EURO|nr:uncharacterized protein N7468_009805 [Penicillium chermesinum]KAJ5216797.1 hypothetical protein N7468_009805 [Penicillium chermesinum]